MFREKNFLFIQLCEHCPMCSRLLYGTEGQHQLLNKKELCWEGNIISSMSWNSITHKAVGSEKNGLTKSSYLIGQGINIASNVIMDST